MGACVRLYEANHLQHKLKSEENRSQWEGRFCACFVCGCVCLCVCVCAAFGQEAALQSGPFLFCPSSLRCLATALLSSESHLFVFIVSLSPGHTTRACHIPPPKAINLPTSLFRCLPSLNAPPPPLTQKPMYGREEMTTHWRSIMSISTVEARNCPFLSWAWRPSL
jgi:hypothetical protein